VENKNLFGLFCLISLIGCSPTVRLAAPTEPIVMNLNIKIEHKLKIEKELDKVMTDKNVF